MYVSSYRGTVNKDWVVRFMHEQSHRIKAWLNDKKYSFVRAKLTKKHFENQDRDPQQN